MSDVFISYAREDEPTAHVLATALESIGWSVWWDRRIPAGTEFSHVIEHELTNARSVIVLWSKQSIASRYVRDEAGAAERRSVLIPALIESVEPPLGFRQTQTANLIGWTGDGPHPGFDKIVEAIERLTQTSAAHPPTFGPGLKRRRAIAGWLAGALAVCIAIFAAGYYFYFGSPPSEMTSSEMAALPGGQFQMGSTESEAKDALLDAEIDQPIWAEREQPKHTVTLDPFLIDRFEVTIGDFRNFIDTVEGAAPHPSLDTGVNDDHPVTGVTWFEANAYCSSVGKRLPTEAEWEYAARDGGNGDYPWDRGPVNGLRANFCDKNCDGREPVSGEDDGFAGTAPVGSFDQGKSRQEVFDLSGNVAEWVADAYDPRFYEKPGNSNPINREPHPDGYRVVRGGSYEDGPYYLRAATRNYRSEDTRDPNIGFRCAQTTNSGS